MNWASAADFFAMGGYAPYVWGAYGMTLVLMLIEPMLAVRRRRQALRDAADHHHNSNHNSNHNRNHNRDHDDHDGDHDDNRDHRHKDKP